MLLSQRWQSIIISSLAVFSIFFGSNVFVPLLIGQKTGCFYNFGYFGLFISDVLMLFLGLFGIILVDGDKRKYFSELPYPLYFVLITFFVCLLGPFGIFPRCINIAFGGVSALWPSLSLSIFSFVFCLCVALLTLDKNNVVNFIGKYLTPIKLSCFLLIIFFALYSGPSTPTNSFIGSRKEALLFGLSKGYHAADLIAAFFFGPLIYYYIKDHIEPSIKMVKKEIFYRSFIACGLGTIIFGLIFFILTFVGAQFSFATSHLSHEMIFPTITKIAMGRLALFVLAVTLLFSCLATSVVLAEIFIEFLHEEVFNNILTRNYCLAITITIGFFMSLIGFAKLFDLFSYILNITYPLFILFSVYKVIALIFFEKLFCKKGENNVI